MRVALVHDYLIQDGGAERVLLALHELFPLAPIYTLFYDSKRADFAFHHTRVIASTLNDLPFAPRHYQWYLPFMAQAIERFDFHEYDVIISSSSSFAKGAISSPNALHICYCHTPTRFLWQERVKYLHELQQSKVIKLFLPYFLHRLRQWDRIAAERPDIFITNSRISQARIERYYGRKAEIIYPPVDTERIPLSLHSGLYWLAGGRLVSYKRFDLVVKAFAKLNLPLKIYGQGPELHKLKNMAGKKTEFLGYIDEQTKIDLYSHAIGYLYPQVEDFGISAIEAMSAGRPVIAFGDGGATETVLPGVTGELFSVQCWEDIGNAVIRFDASRYDPTRIRAHAEQFSKHLFLEKMKTFIDEAWKTHIRHVTR